MLRVEAQHGVAGIGERLRPRSAGVEQRDDAFLGMVLFAADTERLGLPVSQSRQRLHLRDEVLLRRNVLRRLRLGKPRATELGRTHVLRLWINRPICRRRDRFSLLQARLLTGRHGGGRLVLIVRELLVGDEVLERRFGRCGALCTFCQIGPLRLGRCGALCTFCKLLRGITIGQPLLEAAQGGLGDSAEAVPALRIVRQIGPLRLGRLAVPEHHLVLIKLAVDHLVDDEHRRVIWKLCRRLLHEDVDVVLVPADGAADVAIVALHRDRPRLATLVGAAAFRPGRVLDRDVEPADFDVPLLVVPGLLLRLGGLGELIGWRSRSDLGRAIDVDRHGCRGRDVQSGFLKHIGLSVGALPLLPEGAKFARIQTMHVPGKIAFDVLRGALDAVAVVVGDLVDLRSGHAQQIGDLVPRLGGIVSSGERAFAHYPRHTYLLQALLAVVIERGMRAVGHHHRLATDIAALDRVANGFLALDRRVLCLVEVVDQLLRQPRDLKCFGRHLKHFAVIVGYDRLKTGAAGAVVLLDIAVHLGGEASQLRRLDDHALAGFGETDIHRRHGGHIHLRRARDGSSRGRGQILVGRKVDRRRLCLSQPLLDRALQRALLRRRRTLRRDRFRGGPRWISGAEAAASSAHDTTHDTAHGRTTEGRIGNAGEGIAAGVHFADGEVLRDLASCGLRRFLKQTFRDHPPAEALGDTLADRPLHALADDPRQRLVAEAAEDAGGNATDKERLRRSVVGDGLDRLVRLHALGEQRLDHVGLKQLLPRDLRDLGTDPTRSISAAHASLEHGATDQRGSRRCRCGDLPRGTGGNDGGEGATRQQHCRRHCDDGAGERFHHSGVVRTGVEPGGAERPLLVVPPLLLARSLHARREARAVLGVEVRIALFAGLAVGPFVDVVAGFNERRADVRDLAHELAHARLDADLTHAQQAPSVAKQAVRTVLLLPVGLPRLDAVLV